MKILIVSDSHGRSYYLDQTILKVSPIDLLIHLGDFEGDEEYIREVAPCPVEMVAGNNDFFTSESREIIRTIGKYKVLLTHGHRYQVYGDTTRLREAAAQKGADIVMYGHTHVPLIDTSDSIWVINPGSISLPRQEGRKPTFIIMDLDERGEAHFTLNYIKE